MSKEPALLERFIGTILGVAVGDALGAPIEGWSKESISQVLGYIRGYQLTLMGKGIYTDDTQLTLLLLKSILSRGKLDPVDFAHEIGEWMRRSDEGIESARGVGKSVSIAARKLYRGIPWNISGENSPSNGAAVRIAPLVLLHHRSDDIEMLMKDIENSALPTHADPLAIQGAKLLALALRNILNEERFFFNRMKFINELLEAAEQHAPLMVGCLLGLRGFISKQPLGDKVFPPLPKQVPIQGIRLQRDYIEINEMLEEIGTGKYVLESIPAAICCFINSPSSFEDTLLNAVNAGGDTDSIAAMAGALSGALNGASAIPMRWLMELENKDEIIFLANRLHDIVMGIEIEEPSGTVFYSYATMRLTVKS